MIPNTSLFNLESATTPIHELLTDTEHTVLGLGLKFIPHYSATPKKIIESLSSSLSNFKRSLLLQTYFYNHANTNNNTKFSNPIPRIHNNSWIPSLYDVQQDPAMLQLHQRIHQFVDTRTLSLKLFQFRSQLSPLERLINETIYQLRNKETLVIQAADKNLGTCIMYKSTYTQYCVQILNDSATYQSIVIDPLFDQYDKNKLPFITAGYARLKALLIKHQCYYQTSYKRKWTPPTTTINNEAVGMKRTTKLATSLMQLASSSDLRPTGSFYILMKMHKPTISGRPIVNCINTMTYHASQYLDKIFQPIIKLLPTVTTSSLDSMLLLEALPPIHDPSNAVIFCADVKNLYPSIPLEHGIKSVRSILHRYMVSNIDFLMDLLRWVLTHNYLEFNSQKYLQISGTAMGTPCAPSYANMVLTEMELPIIESVVQPIIYLRYLDDIFAIFKHKDDAQLYEQKFNAISNAIQLDATTIASSGIFLDMQISISIESSIHPHNSGKCKFRLYQKPMNKYLYLTPKSSHKRHIYSNFIINELKRYRLFNSSDEDYILIKEAFYQRLLLRGYQHSFLSPIFNQLLPLRQEMIEEIKLKRMKEKNNNMHHPNNNKKKTLTPIIAVINLPKLSANNFNPTRFFDVPDEIKCHPIFKKAFNCDKYSKTVIGRKLGKNLLRLTTKNSSSNNSNVEVSYTGQGITISEATINGEDHHDDDNESSSDIINDHNSSRKRRRIDNNIQNDAIILQQVTPR